MRWAMTAATAVFQAAGTIVIAATLFRRSDPSWLDIGQGAVLWIMSVGLPMLWTRAALRKLRELDVPLQELQFAIVMPSFCAIAATIIALQLVRR